MTRRGAGPTLTERSERAGIGSGHEEARGARHCWVSGLPDYPGRWPGLLTEWRRDAEGWSALVSFAVTTAGHTTLVQSWLEARHLGPAN
jgi:hypothetical protein